ncbi:MAG: hypothetical protein Q4A32_08440 [Lachnospiraceae bacterium]|nr:hypothetical protein [Lachnospiraceae bacterium]
MSALYDKELIPLSTWQEEIKQVLKKAEKHVVIWGELDASLIRRGNRLLEAYCLSLIGKPLHEVTGKNIHFIDYRSCIYSDEECTIILCATYKGYNAADLTTAEILQTDSVENFRNSPMLADIAAIVRQMDVLLECKSEIGELRPGKRRETERLNDKMLALSVQMQKDDRIENVVEREIYSYIKEEFGIPELKESVMNDLGIIVGESRDRFISKFNNLSAFAVPFILIATVFQMGFLKFEEAISLTGRCADIGWIAVAILVAVLVITIVRMGGRDDQGGG